MNDSTGKCCENASGGFTCPITGFRFCLNKCFLIPAIAMVIWTAIFGWIWHGNVMKQMYMDTASLWRPVDQMNGAALHGGMALGALIAAYIFMKGYEGRGLKEGLRFGIIMTLLFLGCGLVGYATQPMPSSLIMMWTLGDLINYSVGGMIMGMLLKKCNR